MTTPEPDAREEAAREYVKEQDYIFDENREIAGNAHLDGQRVGEERVLSLLRSVDCFVEFAEATGSMNYIADWLEARLKVIEKEN